MPFLAPLLPMLASAVPFVAPDAPGSHISLTEADVVPAVAWTDDEPIVGTYFFYWYDRESTAHFLNGDGSDALVDHPTDPDDYSWKSADWWERELRDVLDAGIDFIAPVYWGVPGQYESGHFHWSFEGLPPLVEAWERLRAAGESPPQVALFYDTSTLRHSGEGRHIDLTTADGKEWFYATIRDFFSLIPPKMWAMRGGGPIVFLYSAAFAKAQDPSIFGYLDERFRSDFACEPYVVREVSWQGETDAIYAWGGALGLKPYSVAALGPGYDHHAVPGRDPLVVERRGGDFYRESWDALLGFHPDRRARIAMVETWNELHEGTDICDTVEFGRQYIDMTAEYATRFRAGEHIAHAGSYAVAEQVEVSLAREPEEAGLHLVNGGDGVMEAVVIDGVECWETRPNAHGSAHYAYFDVDESFLFDEAGVSVRVDVTYRDAGCDAFEVHYDASDSSASVREGAFAHGGSVSVGRTGEWKTATFELTGCRFANRANGADFRLAALGAEPRLAVSRVVVRAADR
jgi:hypothetical protein